MRIVVHIGLPKTGSSALQLALLKGREALLEHGVCYPLAGAGGLSAHHHLAWKLQEEAGVAPRHALFDEREGRWGLLKKECKRNGGGTVLLSSEYFSTLPPSLLAKALSRISRRRVEIVGYIRRQDELAVSEYCEGAKCGVVAALFEDVLKRYFNDQKVKRRYSFGAYFADWAAVFGSGNISLRVYERCPRNAGGVVGDFCGWLGVPMLEEVRPPVGMSGINASPGPKTLAAIMKLRGGALSGVAPREFAAMDAAFVRRAANTLGWNEQRFQPWTEAEREAFLRRFAEDTSMLRGRYGLPDDSVFPESRQAGGVCGIYPGILRASDWMELAGVLAMEYAELKRQREIELENSAPNPAMRDRWRDEQRVYRRLREAMTQIMDSSG